MKDTHLQFLNYTQSLFPFIILKDSELQEHIGNSIYDLFLLQTIFSFGIVSKLNVFSTHAMCGSIKVYGKTSTFGAS